jgi:hypothetical protein
MARLCTFVKRILRIFYIIINYSLSFNIFNR